MANTGIKRIPNILTTMRMFLTIPICWFILEERYGIVLVLAFIAGISDGLDGWLARKLNAPSVYGSIADPASDKVMLVTTYVTFAYVGLLSWWIAVVVVIRDLVIVSGAVTYYFLFGRYEMAPSFWGKASTGVQIVFALMLLTQQVFPVFPSFSLQAGLWLVIVLACISGGHYVYVWSRKALVAKRK
ncbi:CDP-alcohol phosphatidyltransferase family protein [uncultured Photobacterium sp.]|uniref:CDP-alcohol phosphatidyltransferase family protein n=1 Tax=uncultured Photobacterium sp. TaxID=173973 RepID=UPI00261F666B|nr:CDP-alcohol phosphatidyltransferase family protein [uncultured Photobacterium sp.]